MTQTTTQNDIIRYVYRETSSEENYTIENALLFDSELRDFYNEIRYVVASVSKAQRKPSSRVTARILNYSKNHKLQSIDQN